MPFESTPKQGLRPGFSMSGIEAAIAQRLLRVDNRQQSSSAGEVGRMKLGLDALFD